jgi:ABC-type transporter Mla subunit MlaD
MKLISKTNAQVLAEIASAIEAAMTEIDPSALESLAEDFQSKFDDMGERAQEGERGQALSSLSETLASLYGEINDAIETLSNAASTLNDTISEFTEA